MAKKKKKKKGFLPCTRVIRLPILRNHLILNIGPLTRYLGSTGRETNHRATVFSSSSVVIGVIRLFSSYSRRISDCGEHS